MKTSTVKLKKETSYLTFRVMGRAFLSMNENKKVFGYQFFCSFFIVNK